MPQNKDKSDSNTTSHGKRNADGPSDLMVGTVLFIIFLIFMTLWMMYRLPE